MDAFTFVLESLDDTARLGTLLAGMMQNAPQVRALLLQGDLGSGKTTLLNILAALDKPTGGEVLLGGRRPRSPVRPSPSATIIPPARLSCTATSTVARPPFPTKSGTRWTPMQASTSWNGPSISPKRPFPRNFWTSGWSHAKRDDS